MDLVSLLLAVFASWWLLSLSLYIGSTAAACLQPAIRRRNATRSDQPPVSVVIPVKEVTPNLETATVSLFSQPYPDFEVLVSSTETPSPALDVVRKIAAGFPLIKSSFISSDPHAAINPKLNNLATPLAGAEHNLILVKDANISLSRDQLSELVRYFSGKTGLVVAVPVGLQPIGFSAEIECALMNNYVARYLLAGSAIGWGFGIGAVMLFDRRDFNRAGGITSVAIAIGEDHAISKALARVERKTMFAASEVTQVIGRRRLSEIWLRQIRWLVCRRIEEPAAYYFEPFIGLAFTTLAGAIGVRFFSLPICPAIGGTVLVWLATALCLNIIKGWGLSWKSPFAILCSELMLPVLWVQACLTRKLYWGATVRDIKRG